MNQCSVRRIIRRIVGSVILVLPLAACGGGGETHVAVGRRFHLETVTVSRMPVTRWRTVPGTVQGVHDAVVRTLTGGVVSVRPYRIGSHVSRGALLLVVGGVRARAELARAHAAWIAARAQARLAALNERRYRALVKQGAVTREEYDEVERRNLAAQAALRAARLALQAAHRLASHAIVRAPFSGIIASLPVHLGEDVPSGTVLLRLVGEGAEVRTRVGSDLYRHLRLGETVRLRTSQRTESGVIVALDAVLDPRSRTHRVTILLRGRHPAIGAYVRVSFPVGVYDALVLPRRALVQRAGNDGVFVVGSRGRVAFTLVRRGARLPDRRIVIRAGLASGERVVLNPPRTLVSGDVVVGGSHP